MSSSNVRGKPDLNMTKEQAEDIFVRFFLNMPPSTISNEADFSIQLENAFYYFLTYHKNDKKTDLKSKNYQELTKNFFNQIPQLQQILNTNGNKFITRIGSLHDKLRDEAIACGCICYNSTLTHVLVVHHTTRKKMFSFPKGKMSEGESYLTTAARETLEETGIDVSPYITDKYMFKYSRKQKSDVYMFHVKNVPMDPSKKLKSPSPLEIDRVRWVPINIIGHENNDFYPDGPTKKIIPLIHEFLKQQTKK